MARTRLFKALRRAMLQSSAIGPRALSRRSFLTLSLALAACQGRGGVSGDIAIVGGGVAGLTAAYRLANAGRRVTLYEASDRLGGRMFTRRDFNADGQFCELGGELVDSNHTALRDLCGELGLAIARVAPENGEEFYHIDGRLRTQSDMIDPTTGQGAFARLGPRIAEDQIALLDGEENWTDHARALDQTSLADYLARLSNLAPAWAMEVIAIAYHGEFGLPVQEQSALNLIDFISAETAEGFRVFGESDEAFRIGGGSSSLPDALAARLQASATVHLRHALAAIARTESGMRLGFDVGGARVEREHAHVILALPFTKLRAVEGVGALGLPEAQVRAIRELGYGDNAKLMLGTTSRPWTEASWPKPTAGVFYSDAFQLIWETSRGQAGERGILTNFLASQQNREDALRNARSGLQRIAPQIAASLEEGVSVFMPWARQPFTLGSYASARVGQYTTLLENTATPSEDGRIHFAGEHTSVDFLGFMNGGVESGERAAAALLA